MEESAVFHTSEKKTVNAVSKEGPGEARVHTSRSKQMVLVILDAKGVIYTNYVPKSETINAEYINTFLERRGLSHRPSTGGCTGTKPRSILPPQSSSTWWERG